MKPLLFLVSVLTVFSCNQEYHHILNDAESLLRNRPDSSIVLLRTIEPQHLQTNPLRARYALLMSAALDKNYIDVTSDSLISIATNYYESAGDDRHRMLAWYYQGIVLKNAQRYNPAIVSFEKAEHYAHKTNDNLYSGLICRNKSVIFGQTNNNPGAIANKIDAIRYFDLAEAPEYKAYAEVSLITDYANQKEYGKADSLIRYVRSHYQDTILHHYCNLREASMLVIHGKEPEKAIALYRSTPLRYFGLLDYAYFALAYEMYSKPDSANIWFSKGYSYSKDQADSASIDYLRSKMEIQRGHPEAAFKLVDYAATVQDSLTRILLQQSVSIAQKDYFKSESLRQEEKMKLMKKREIANWVMVLLILTLMGIVLVSRNREKDRRLKEHMAQLALEEKELKRVNKDNAHLVGALFSERIAKLDKLSRDYFRLDDKKQKEIIYKEVKQGLASLQEDEGLFLSLEKDLDRYCNGIMEKLRMQVPRIKGENLKIISLFFAGFSYETVQLLLNKVSIDSLKTARSRYRKEIIDAKAPDTEFFLKMLEMKRRPQADTNESGDC